MQAGTAHRKVTSIHAIALGRPPWRTCLRWTPPCPSRHRDRRGVWRRVTAEITEQVRLLDGLVRYRFSDNAELMGAWASARNVLGPFKTRSEPPADEGQAPEGTPLSPLYILLPQRVEPVILSAVGAKDLLFSALLDPIPRC